VDISETKAKIDVLETNSMITDVRDLYSGLRCVIPIVLSQ